MYSSTLPKKVAPIRSARETDAELLPMYGPIAFGFSGSVAAVHALVRRAGLVDVSADVGGRGYSRMPSRPAPHNMATVPKTLIERADGSVMPRDVGFTFGPAPLGGTPATAVTAKYPAARITLKYVPATQTWAYSLGGELDRSSEGTVAPTTVIVQSVRMLANVRQDRIGSAVPMSRTVGSGKATILRDGRAYSVTWSRPSVDSPTRWLYQGKDFPMKAGQVWVMLLDAKRKAVVVSPKPSPTPTSPVDDLSPPGRVSGRSVRLRPGGRDRGWRRSPRSGCRPAGGCPAPSRRSGSYCSGSRPVRPAVASMARSSSSASSTMLGAEVGPISQDVQMCMPPSAPGSPSS